MTVLYIMHCIAVEERDKKNERSTLRKKNKSPTRCTAGISTVQLAISIEGSHLALLHEDARRQEINTGGAKRHWNIKLILIIKAKSRCCAKTIPPFRQS